MAHSSSFVSVGLALAVACVAACKDGDDDTEGGVATTSTSTTTTTATTTTTTSAGTTDEPTTSTSGSTTSTSTDGTSTGETSTGTTGVFDEPLPGCSVDQIDELVLLEFQPYGQMTDLNFAPDRRYIVFQDFSADFGTVARRDVCGGEYTVLLTFPESFNAHPRVVGDTLYVAHSSDFEDAGIRRYAIDAQANVLDEGVEIVDRFAIGALDVSPDAKYAIYWVNGGGSPYLHDLKTNQAMQVDGLGIYSYFSPDSTRILSHDSGQLDVYTIADGTIETHPVGGQNSVNGMAWLPDGQRAVVAIGTMVFDDTIGVYDLGSKTFTEVVSDARGQSATYLAVDQGGTRIAFTDINGQDVAILDLP